MAHRDVTPSQGSSLGGRSFLGESMAAAGQRVVVYSISPRSHRFLFPCRLLVLHEVQQAASSVVIKCVLRHAVRCRQRRWWTFPWVLDTGMSAAGSEVGDAVAPTIQAAKLLRNEEGPGATAPPTALICGDQLCLRNRAQAALRL
jgi:hypothetical protein